jgi:hypothetical protein
MTKVISFMVALYYRHSQEMSSEGQNNNPTGCGY